MLSRVASFSTLKKFAHRQVGRCKPRLIVSMASPTAPLLPKRSSVLEVSLPNPNSVVQEPSPLRASVSKLPHLYCVDSTGPPYLSQEGSVHVLEANELLQQLGVNKDEVRAQYEAARFDSTRLSLVPSVWIAT